MIIYVTTRDGSIFTVDKKAAEAIVYNTAGWITANRITIDNIDAIALLRTWDICALKGGDAAGNKALSEIAADYTIDNGYPFIARE